MRLWFPEVTSNTVKIMWSPPLEPNGIITGYMVTYRRDDVTIVFNSSVIVASQQEYYISSLVNNKYYSFSVMAKTRRGWGAAASAKVYTTVNRSKYPNKVLCAVHVMFFILCLIYLEFQCMYWYFKMPAS